MVSSLKKKTCLSSNTTKDLFKLTKISLATYKLTTLIFLGSDSKSFKCFILFLISWNFKKIKTYFRHKILSIDLI